MSKLSLHAVDQLYKSNSEDPVLLLLTFNFPNSDVYRFVNNSESIVSNGNTFTSFPFVYTLPNDDTQSLPELRVSIPNVGLDLIDSFRQNTQDVKASINVVFASAPDFSEISINNLEVKQISYDASFINIDLGYQDTLSTKIPSYSYTPKDYPGVFDV